MEVPWAVLAVALGCGVVAFFFQLWLESALERLTEAQRTRVRSLAATTFIFAVVAVRIYRDYALAHAHRGHNVDDDACCDDDGDGYALPPLQPLGRAEARHQGRLHGAVLDAAAQQAHARRRLGHRELHLRQLRAARRVPIVRGRERPAPAPKKRRKRVAAPVINFVHVGKAGGGTVVRFLEDNGLSFNHFHARAPSEKRARRRRPAAPSTGATRGGGGGHNLGDRTKHSMDRWELKFYTCFETVDAFAAALDPGRNDTCGELATQVFAPERPGHISHGLAFYLADVGAALRDLARTSVYLVRQESLQVDVDGVAAWLKVDPELLNTTLPHAHAATPRGRRGAGAGAPRLPGAYLDDEVAYLAALENHAANGRGPKAVKRRAGLPGGG
ncbi:hypothetical protein JL720_2831 [Aureococcus anophagefferens]|nr:hypothetical protein JL720_2831 [Aureococcus anophagefferens]